MQYPRTPQRNNSRSYAGFRPIAPSPTTRIALTVLRG